MAASIQCWAALLAVLVPGTSPPPSTWADRAHPSVVSKVRADLLPSLRSYEAIAADLDEQLSAADTARQAVETLDSLRKSTAADVVENSVPGFPFLLKTFDKVAALSTRLGEIQTEMVALRTAAKALEQTTRAYVTEPSAPTFVTMLRAFEGSSAVFARSKAAFGDIDTFARELQQRLTRSREMVVAVQEAPVIGDLAGEYLTPLRDQVDALNGRLQLIRAIAAMVIAAIERDGVTLASLRTTMAEAEAHDAYESAVALADANRPGSALSALRDVRATWPDTAWAHRADRRIVTLVRQMDALPERLAGATSTIARLEREHASARAQLSQTQSDLATLRAADTTPPASPNRWVWGLVALVCVGLLGAGVKLARQRG